MLLTRWMLVSSICLNCSALKADDTVAEVDLSTAKLVKQTGSTDAEAADHAAQVLTERYDSVIENESQSGDDAFAARSLAAQELVPLIPKLVAAFDHSDDEVRESAIEMFSAFGPFPEEQAVTIWKAIVESDLRFEDDEDEAEWACLWSVVRRLHELRALLPDDVPAMKYIVPRIRASLDTDLVPLRDFRFEYEATEPSINLEFFGESIHGFADGVGWNYFFACEAGWGPIEVPGLLDLASNEFPQVVRLWSLLMLANMGIDAIAAVPALEGLLESEDELIRLLAASTILTLQGEEADLDTLMSAAQLSEECENRLRDDHAGFVARRAEESDLTRRRDPESYRPKFRNKEIDYARQDLKYSRGALRHHAVRTLIDWGPYARPALPELREALGSPDPVLRELAEQAIAEIEGE